MGRIALVIAAAAVVAAVGCKRGQKAPPTDQPDDTGWHVQAIEECAAQVELPGPADRRVVDTIAGARRVAYATPPDAPEMYIVECMAFDQPTGVSPADVLRDQLAKHLGPNGYGDIGLRITGSGSTAATDGGTYWITFDNGMRIEGAVHVHGNDILDVSGSIPPGEAAARATVARVLASYRAN